MSVSDNATANGVAIAGGPTFRLFSDGTAEWPASVPAYVLSGAPGSWSLQYVSEGTPLPIAGKVGIQVGGADVAQSNPVPTAGLQVTPRAGSASAIVTGGTAITAVSGPINGGYVTNPSDAAAQGIGVAENAYIDMVGTPGATDAAANGTTSLLQPGQTFALPALAAGVNVKLNAATAAHAFTVVVW